MRVLVVGAGAIGGYFGGRMLQAGRDVTFLVRPRRAAELASAGLVIKSPNGDVTLNNPPTVQADKLSDKFDVVLLSCKAFDLEDAIDPTGVLATFAKALTGFEPKMSWLQVIGWITYIAVVVPVFVSHLRKDRADRPVVDTQLAKEPV